AVWAWVSRCAARSSTRMAESCGRPTTPRAGPSSGSHCRRAARVSPQPRKSIVSFKILCEEDGPAVTSAFTRVCDALCPRVTGEGGAGSPSQRSKTSLRFSALQPEHEQHRLVALLLQLRDERVLAERDTAQARKDRDVLLAADLEGHR